MRDNHSQQLLAAVGVLSGVIHEMTRVHESHYEKLVDVSNLLLVIEMEMKKTNSTPNDKGRK